jgi:hypothetical protein
MCVVAAHAYRQLPLKRISSENQLNTTGCMANEVVWGWGSGTLRPCFH